MAIFADVQYCIYADRVGGWVRKSPKTCRRSIGMVPNVISIRPVDFTVNTFTVQARSSKYFYTFTYIEF